jgi:hypothetical protein
MVQDDKAHYYPCPEETIGDSPSLQCKYRNISQYSTEIYDKSNSLENKCRKRLILPQTHMPGYLVDLPALFTYTHFNEK